MRFPENLKYTKDHEWVKVDGKNATVGITHHAQSALGDIVFVELPQVGRVLKSHETFGVVESIKAVSDLYSPIAGKVIETNPAVVSDPALINRDPHAQAWLIKMEIADMASLSDLLDAGAYAGYVETIK